MEPLEEGEPERITEPDEPLSPELVEALKERGITFADWNPEVPSLCSLHDLNCVQHACGRLWRHERRGSFLLARLLCHVLGHNWNVWLDEDGELSRGDCRRCWA